MPDFIAAFCIITAGLAGLCFGLTIGYNAGVKEAESRWSEAVAKADAARKPNV